MVFEEVSWLRAHHKKFCPVVTKCVLDWYRLCVPCYLHKPYKYMKQRWNKVPVIVQVEEVRAGKAFIKELANSARCPVQRELPLINAFSTKANEKNLQLLVQNKYVKKIWYDREVRTVLDVASAAVKAVPLWEKGFTGKGVTIAVIDTGIHDHPDLSGRIVGFKDLVKNKNKPYDDNGHGTHVAGCAVSNGSKSDSRYRGPAPEANLVGVKVLNKRGAGLLSAVISGIQWCVENKEKLKIKVLNLSLGSDAPESYKNDPVCLAVEKAWEAGIVVCAAAGNSGPQSRTIGSPGIDPVIITVGALDDNNTASLEDDQAAGFSSRGPTGDGLVKPDVIAPGVNIVSLRSPKSMIDKQQKQSRVDDWYTSLSGTSMATPLCAGVVAQLLQAKSTLSPDQVKTRLMQTAVKLASLDENTQGAGVLDAQKALDEPDSKSAEKAG